MYKKYGQPLDWLRNRDYDSENGIIKFGKMHIRYGTEKMYEYRPYMLEKGQINVHYDRFDVIRNPVLHIIFDTFYQTLKGVR